MTDIFLILNFLLLIGIIIFLYFFYKNSGNNGNSPELGNLATQLLRDLQRLEGQLKENRSELSQNNKDTRSELSQTLHQFSQSLLKQMNENTLLQSNHSKDAKIELSAALKSFEENFHFNMQNFNQLQKQRMEEMKAKQGELTQITEIRLEKMRETLEKKLQFLQEENSKKLELMRATVDEKLHATLEKRLGESFQMVSERLEQVHKGLGEMQSLAIGVGDLKKVLSNVKTRGTLGEYQLENILEQLLSPDQYAKNVKTKVGSNAFVEFAIKLPAKDEANSHIWIPLDAKFPTEDYQWLIEAYEKGKPEQVEQARKALSSRIKSFAKDMKDKYLDPPNTTDFAIMFLPFEGLFAEILRDVGLFETLQRDYRVTITGPTTLAAILNSLQMGFRTLAIEKRSGEVWNLLSAVKTEFSYFGEILDKTQKKLQEAGNVIEKASTRSRAIERKLKNVQELPTGEAEKYLGSAWEELE